VVDFVDAFSNAGTILLTNGGIPRLDPASTLPNTGSIVFGDTASVVSATGTVTTAHLGQVGDAAGVLSQISVLRRIVV
jgi:hypothetical protein